MNELLLKLFNSAFSGLIFRKSSATAAAILQLQQQYPSESILNVELPPYSMIGDNEQNFSLIIRIADLTSLSLGKSAAAAAAVL